jgi:hypothetical protein
VGRHDHHPDRRAGGGVTLLADEDLMSLVRQGDAAAFEVVYERQRPPRSRSPTG